MSKRVLFIFETKFSFKKSIKLSTGIISENNGIRLEDNFSIENNPEIAFRAAAIAAQGK